MKRLNQASDSIILEKNTDHSKAHHRVNQSIDSIEDSTKDEEEQNESEKQAKNRLIVALLISVATTQTLYANIATFFPPYRLQYHPSLSDTIVGFILAIFQVAIIVASPFIGHRQAKMGRKNTILIGYFNMIIASVLFGLLAHISNDFMFFVLAIIIRFVQGFGNACINVAVLSIVAIEFPEKKLQYFGYCEAATGIGMMGGPIVGQIFYSTLGFEGCFYCTAGMLFIAMIISYYQIPDRINTQDEEEEDTNEVKVPYKAIVKSKNIMMALISAVMATTFMIFCDPIISDQLLELGVSEHIIGYIFAVSCFAYAASSSFVGLLSKCVPKLLITQGAFFLCTIPLLILGPSKILGFPESKAMTIVGFTFLGALEAFIYVPILPILIEAMQQHLQLGENQELNDKASSLFTVATAIGCIIGPILGGMFNDLFGFRTTCDLMAFASLLYTLLFFFVNILPEIREKRSFKKWKESISESQTSIKFTQPIKGDNETLRDEIHPVLLLTSSGVAPTQ